MLNLTIKTNRLKEATEAISALVDEARFKLTADGIAVKAVDHANVAMVSLDLTKDAFDSYEATEGELGIDLKKLNGIMEMADKNDGIEIELDETAHKLIIRMRGLSYTMALLDPSAIKKEPKVPTLDLPAQIVIRGEDLRRAVKAADKVSDYVRLGVSAKDNNNIFFMEAEGDTDSVRLEMTKDELIDLKTADAKSLFLLAYLNSLVRSAGKAQEVTINLGTDYPLKMNFKIADGYGRIEYTVAPRVEEN